MFVYLIVVGWFVAPWEAVVYTVQSNQLNGCHSRLSVSGWLGTSFFLVVVWTAPTSLCLFLAIRQCLVVLVVGGTRRTTPMNFVVVVVVVVVVVGSLPSSYSGVV